MQLASTGSCMQFSCLQVDTIGFCMQLDKPGICMQLGCVQLGATGFSPTVPYYMLLTSTGLLDFYLYYMQFGNMQLDTTGFCM